MVKGNWGQNKRDIRLDISFSERETGIEPVTRVHPRVAL